MAGYEGEWLEELTEKDFPAQFQDLVQLIGVAATVRLADNYGGLAFYVPKTDVLLRKKRDEMIRRDVRIIGYRNTALKYRLTEVWVRQIVDHQGEEGKQEGLFD